MRSIQSLTSDPDETIYKESPPTIYKPSFSPVIHRAMCRNRINKDPFRYYKIIDVLGSGSMGCVRLVQKLEKGPRGNKKTKKKDLSSRYITRPLRLLKAMCFYRPLKRPAVSGSLRNSTTLKGHKMFAIKSVNLSSLSDKRHVRDLMNEIDILKTLDHPNIVRPIETFEYRRDIFIVMELCNGGDLYTRDPYTEDDARKIVRKIVSAVSYMHQFNVIHRDLKYENILFENTHPDAEIKIIDFGLSKKYLPGHKESTSCVGTIYSMAPQVLEGFYDSKADVWSIGVITFMLLSSQFPFQGKRRYDVIQKIKNWDYNFNDKRWEDISDEAVDFIIWLLQYSPEKRPTACEVLEDPFLSEINHDQLVRNSSVINLQLIESISNFCTYSILKKLALVVMAYKLTSEEIGTLRTAFEQFDLNGNGIITYKEFEDILTIHSIMRTEIRKMFNSIDVDGTGVIDYTEFLAATIESLGPINEDRLAEAFDQLDSDNSGYITRTNLRELFSGEMPDAKIDKILNEFNISDGISCTDFLQLWNQQRDAIPRHSRDDKEQRYLRKRHHVSNTNEEIELSTFRVDKVTL